MFASPGAGKTLIAIQTLDCMSLMWDDAFPALIVAPLRVANGVWDAEVHRWENFKRLRVSKILGNARQRSKALNTPAEIYTINYENLRWLRQTLGNTWPFKAVVIDESTRIRGHRCSLKVNKDGKLGIARRGTANASAIASIAPYTHFWMNLSGTPTPKGDVDLWSQQWVIDGGKALGRTFSAFTKEFCRPAWGSTPTQQRFDLVSGAREEILERIKPNTVVLDAYDWFDIKRPIEVNIPVPLPEKAKVIYKKMHDDSLAELGGELKIAALSSAGKVMKCRQIASGVLLDEFHERHLIHTARIDALKDLVDSLNGTPLLVAYNFVHEREAILESFKGKAVQLPTGAKQQEVEKAWNAGEIPVLLIHPASAGHGLNLQHGSNHLCVFTPDWNFELYAQVIERIGPTRQAQSGYDRPVYIHRFYAPGTWDEVILANLKKKYTTSEIIKAALAVTAGDSLVEQNE